MSEDNSEIFNNERSDVDTTSSKSVQRTLDGSISETLKIGNISDQEKSQFTEDSILNSPDIVDKSEYIHVEKVKKRYDAFRSYDVSPLDINGRNYGFVLMNRDMTLQNTDWILSDLDDTMIGTQEVKPRREELFGTYLSSIGISLAPGEVQEIIKKTDNFSRWQDIEGGSKDCYHPVAHMMALQLICDGLSDIKNSSKNSEVLDQRLAELYATLDRIKLQLSDGSVPVQGDPFRFRTNGQFIVRKLPPWSDEIANIFKKTMIAPPVYESNIGVFGSANKIETTNTGIFTSGVPSYQLQKLGELMQNNPDVTFNGIFLTRVEKADFLKELIDKIGIKGKKIIIFDDSHKNLERVKEMAVKNYSEKGNTIIGYIAETPHSKDNGKVGSFEKIGVDQDSSRIREIFQSSLQTSESVDN